MVQVGEYKRAAVVGKIQTDRARDFRERAVVVVGVENVSLTTTPGGVRTDEFIDGVPSPLVVQRRGCIAWRFRYHLPPEETGKVARVRPGNIAVGNVEVGVAVVVKIPGVGGPRPAPHFDARLRAYVLEFSVLLIAVQRVAMCVLAVKCADVLGVFFMKGVLFRDADAGGRPHVRNINILISGIVEIEPGCAHPCAGFLDARFG